MELTTTNNDSAVTENEELEVEENTKKTKAENEDLQEEDSNKKEEKAKESEKVDFKSKYYYLAAELENLKKRHERELENTVKFGNERVLKNLIEVVDNFERTITAMTASPMAKEENFKSWVEGIEMVRKQFLETLAKSGLTPIESLGKIFDPNVHEALSQIEMDDKEEGTIVTEFEKGYMLNGRLLRAAKVVVTKKKES